MSDKESSSGWDEVVGGKSMNEAVSTNLRDLLGNDYSAVSKVIESISKVGKTRAQYLKKLKEIDGFYLTDTIIDTISDDALACDVVDGEIVVLTSSNKKIDKLLQKLQDVVDIDQLVVDIAPDILKKGEYFLGYDEGEVVDDLSQGDYIAAYKNGLPSKFITVSKRTGSVVVEDPGNIIHFTYSSKRIRVDLKEHLGKGRRANKAVENFPKVIRMGRPLFYGGISAKMKELQLLEQLVPAQKLAQVSKGTIVGISVPNSMEPKEAFKAVQRYKNLFNNKKGVNTDTDSISAQDIMQTAGQVQVVPLFGDKGDVRQMDVRDNAKIDDLLNGITDIREVILSSIGIPPSLIFSSDDQKGDIIRQHARYGRMLRALRRSLADGLRLLAYTYLAQNGIKTVKRDDVQVLYRSKLPDIQELDSLELSSAAASIAGDLQTFVVDLMDMEPLSDDVDLDAFKEWLTSVTKVMFGGKSLIKEDDEEKGGKEIAAEERRTRLVERTLKRHTQKKKIKRVELIDP